MRDNVRVFSCGSLVLAALALAAAAHAGASDVDELTKRLHEFLAGASRNDAAVHERFWADDLIYTGSSGRRIGKADILKDVRSAPAPKPGDPVTLYTAEDIRIQPYDKTAVVAFRLVATTSQGGRTEVATFLNTGTFRKSAGQWRAVSWQATRTSRPEEDVRKDVVAAHAALDRALLDADVATLETLLDPTFVWTRGTGERVTRDALLDGLRSGALKYARLETEGVTVALYGPTAVVRGVSTRGRSTDPARREAGDPAPPASSFTVTYINDGGRWKAVAQHTSPTP